MCSVAHLSISPLDSSPLLSQFGLTTALFLWVMCWGILSVSIIDLESQNVTGKEEKFFLFLFYLRLLKASDA
ncbi:hypothetical protein SDC9_51421 [bioreactor metagenome]|uniref:Uncharacterized protein n=1 Tax=bioreactor metagenome TaxID=1076179 RepID=A0A644WMJ8_9ZZZZ